jgi:hypothetical protein
LNDIEDEREFVRKENELKDWPGKIFSVNNGNLDGDNIPDWKDFDISRSDGQPITEPLPFIPMVLTLSDNLDSEKDVELKILKRVEMFFLRAILCLFRVMN